MSTTSQWWFRSTALSGISTFLPLQDGLAAAANATENLLRAPISASGALTTLDVRLSAAPGGSASYRFQVTVNATPSTVLDVTITGSATSGSATGSVAITAGDLVSVKVTAASAPASVTAQTALEFDPTTPNEYVYPCWYGGGAVKGTAPDYQRLLFGNNSDKTSDAFSQSTRDVAPFAGQITSFYIHLSVAPGVGKSWDFRVMVNGVEDATSAINIAGAATTGNVTGLTIAVSAGDYLTFEVKTATGGPANTRIKWCTTFVPTATGLFAIGGAASTSRTTSTNLSVYGQLGNEGTEAAEQIICPASLTLSALYAIVGTAPGVGKTWAWQFRKNTANGNLVCVMNNATTANDTGHTDSLVAGDLLALAMTAGSGPSATTGEAFGFAASTATAILKQRLVRGIGL